MRSLPRREFFADTAKLAAAMAAIPGMKAVAAPDDGDGDTKPSGPNDTVRVAVSASTAGARNTSPAGAHLKDVRITSICDVDLRAAAKGVKLVEQSTKTTPKVVQDIRRLLDDKTIDAISIATPNHWHALATIWACQAGKDVYVEKPVSHNVSEGRRMVEAARKHERIVQTGTQCRSHKGIQDAIAFLRSGKLGQIYMAKGLCYKPRGSIGHKADCPVPADVDYNIWLGPAPERPFNPNRFHYNWHWHWDYGNGDLGNQGIHQMDLARWGLGKNEFPRAVLASGGRFGYSDDGQTPNTLHVGFEFDDCELQFEVRGLYTNDEAKVKIGDIFYGTEGVLAITSYESWQVVLRAEARERARRLRRRRPFRQLHQGRQGTRQEDPDGRHRRGAPLERLLSPREHRLPARPQAADQSLDGVVRRRLRGRRDAHPRVSGAVCGASQGISSDRSRVTFTEGRHEASALSDRRVDGGRGRGRHQSRGVAVDRLGQRTGWPCRTFSLPAAPCRWQAFCYPGCTVRAAKTRARRPVVAVRRWFRGLGLGGGLRVHHLLLRRTIGPASPTSNRSANTQGPSSIVTLPDSPSWIAMFLELGAGVVHLLATTVAHGPARRMADPQAWAYGPIRASENGGAGGASAQIDERCGAS